MKSLRFSLRYLGKSRGGNITRVASLTLGLAVSLLLFSYVSFLLSFNRCFPGHDRMYQVWALYGVQGIGLSSSLHAPVAPSMKQDMPQIESATRTHGVYTYDMKAVGSDATFTSRSYAADTSFCDVFGIKVLSGDPHEVFAGKDRMMISKSLAKISFLDEDPVGKVVTINTQMDLTVGGVFEDVPINTTLGEFNMLLPFDLVVEVSGMNHGWQGGDSFPTYIKLKEGADIAEVEAQMPVMVEKYGMKESFEQWKMEYLITPITKSNFMQGNALSMSRLLSALAFLLLFVATMNYVLVSISGMIRRSRTIALLKCNGAHKGDVFRIFLSETLVLILCALVLAVLLLVALSKPIEQLTAYPMSELFAWKRIWAPFSVLVVAFLLAGLIPARMFTRVPIEAAFKGVTDNKRRWKQVLLGVEIACITCVAALLWVTTLQFRHLRFGDFGYEPSGIISTMFMGRPSQFEQYVQEISALPEVESVGHSYHKPIYGYSGMPCVDEVTHDILFSCRWEVIDRYYIPTMKMEIVDGSNFTEDARATDAIVNQEYVRLRGWTDSPIGHQIIDQQSPDAMIYTIVGVVKDFRMESTGVVQPIVMHHMSMMMNDDSRKYGGMATTIRLRDMSPESMDAVVAKIKTYESANNHAVSVYSDQLNNLLSSVRSLRNVIGVGSAVTLLIALIGLLGYLTDECNRRAREVAVRKVNGATVPDILGLLGRNTIVLVLISVAFGVAGAYFAAGKILEQYVARIPLSWWIFAGSALVVVVVVYVIQFLKTWRIANSNPSLMLKSE